MACGYGISIFKRINFGNMLRVVCLIIAVVEKYTDESL